MPKNLYEQQLANRRNTQHVVVLFLFFFLFLGLGFDIFQFGYAPWASRPADPRSLAEWNENHIPFPLATVFALLFGTGQAWWGLRAGDKAVLRATSAVPVDPSTTDPQLRQLLNVVEEMKIASGLPMPKVYVVPDPDPNAFATGFAPERASIAVTRGLLEKLNREELQGVIAHEMSHIRNLDIRLLTTIAALVGAVVLLSDWTVRSARYGAMGGRGSSSGKGGKGGAGILAILWIVSAILAPVIAQVLAMTVSRQREYLADATGAELTRNPLGLASALKKIEMEHAPTNSIRRGTAHLCIADPLGRRMSLREGRFADLLATHPPMPHRISKLMQMAYQHTPQQPSATPLQAHLK